MAPLLVSFNLQASNGGTFHQAYYGIAAANVVAALMIIAVPSPTPPGLHQTATPTTGKAQPAGLVPVSEVRRRARYSSRQSTHHFRRVTIVIVTSSLNMCRARAARRAPGCQPGTGDRHQPIRADLVPLLRLVRFLRRRGARRRCSASHPALPRVRLNHKWSWARQPSALCFAANWISPFAVLTGTIKDQSEAALLTTAFYGCFTVTRLLAAPLSRKVSSPNILRGCFLGSIGGDD